MNAPTLSTAQQHLEKLEQDVWHFRHMTQEEFFALEFKDVEALQFKHLRERFEELRPKIKLLDRHATQVGINEIASWDDLVALAMPHTMYKGYLATDVDKGRFDRLTRWLGTMTAHDLSGVDLDGCQTLDDWLQRVEAATPVRPVTSSGTSGKISIFPRDTDDEYSWFNAIVNFLSPYGDEKVVDYRSGKVPTLCPWPFDKGRQSVPAMLRILRQHLYNGQEDMVSTQIADTMLVEEQWLTGKLQRSEMMGEELVLTEREQRVVEAMGKRRKAGVDLMGAFAERTVREYRNQPIHFLTGWPQMYDFVMCCKKLGIKPEWAPGSSFFVGGGNKGTILPDNWRELIEEYIPSSRYVFKEMYGMTETTAISPRCSAGYYHPYPWGIYQVVDPDTSHLLPRKGIQTGRMMMFDLMPRSIWACMLTGDEVTIHWNGGCSCGRKGPFFDAHIQRYSEARGGNDKITCTKSTDAYQKLEAFALSDSL